MIEDFVEEEIDLLKPELKDKFSYRFTDEESGAYATTILGLNPPMIVFYTKNIEKMTDKPMRQSVRELISHELLHVLGIEHGERVQHIVENNKFFI